MKIIVSDMGGVLYSFDKSLDTIKHERNFETALQKLNITSQDIKEQLKGEWEAVNKEILKVHPFRQNITNLLKVLKKGGKLVIVSTSLIKTSKLILERIGMRGKAWKIFDMSDFGSKKEKDAWRKVFIKLPGVDVIIEDSERNLSAAKQAAQELNFKPSVHTRVPY